VTSGRITLVGDGIENPWNARTLIDAAAMFGSRCLFRDRARLADAWREVAPAPVELALLSRDDLMRDYTPIVACDTLEGAASIYGCRLADGPRPAVVVGNERRGLARDIQAIATQVVQIPLVSRQLTSLNAAAAAAVALFYLERRGGGAMMVRGDPSQRRPEIAMVGPGDHVELGSAVRSAGAFGWQRLLVEDRAGVWFGVDRGMYTEGRAAARRQRNPIRLVPVPVSQRYAFDEVCIVTVKRQGTPLHRAQLARGPDQIVVLPDESFIDVFHEDWERFGQSTRLVHLELPTSAFPYHYRLIATIALAEVARQVGQRAAPGQGRPRPPGLFYDRALELLADARGESVWLDELAAY
jgi:hypothetical protein